MHTRRRLRAVLGRADFRRLLVTRLNGQFGDGVFQASLAGAVLFNPERQAHAADVAAGFAVVLLPYSLVGPFAGVLLDRWWRQRVLVVANVVRALGVVGIAAEVAAGLHGEPFYVSALLVVSVNRFFLSALSASLPHVVAPDALVTANAFTTTAGSIATTLGGACAILVRAVIGSTDAGYAAIALAAAVPYAASALAARGFPLAMLGPDEVERSSRETVGDVTHGLLAGARHIAERRRAAYALIAVGAHRFWYGVSVIATLLLYRNYFTGHGLFRAGLAGLAQLVLLVAVGSAIAAAVTPAATRRMGFVWWPALLLVFAGAVQIGLGLPYSMPLVLLAGAGLGFAAQGLKISADTVVQQCVSDEFRGRVFSLYDTLFNVAFVSAAVVAAIVLPDDGYAPAAVVVVGAGYAVTGLLYLRFASRLPESVAEPAEVAAVAP